MARKNNAVPLKTKNSLAVIKDAADKVLALRSKCKSIKAEEKEVLAGVKALGVKMAEFNSRLRIYDLSVEDRADVFKSLRLIDEALNLDTQGDLFDEDDDQDSAAGELVTEAAPPGVFN